jgi:hypothetical protein
MNRIILIALIAIAITACQKNNNTAPDASKVSITISSPQEGAVYHSGDTVHIIAAVTYPSELHGYELTITDSVGNVVYDLDDHVHDNHFEIDSSWVITGTQPGPLKLKLEAEIDHNGNSAEKTVNVHYRP